MITRRGALGGVGAVLGAVGVGVVVGRSAASLESDTPPPPELVEVREAIAHLAKGAEGLAHVVYGLTLGVSAVRGKKSGGSIQMLEALVETTEGLGQLATPDVRSQAPPLNPIPTPSGGSAADSPVVQASAGGGAHTPQAQDIVMAPAQAVTQGVTATLWFTQPPVLPGREGQPLASLYVTPVVWDGQGQPHYGQPFLIEAVELNAPFSLYAPDLQQPDLTEPGSYRLGYRLWETDDGPDLTGGGPILHVLADEDWAYEAILAEANTQPRPETVYSQTYAYAPETGAAVEAQG